MGFLHRHRILAQAKARDALIEAGVSCKEAKERVRAVKHSFAAAQASPAEIVHVDAHTRSAPKAVRKAAKKAKGARRGKKA